MRKTAFHVSREPYNERLRVWAQGSNPASASFTVHVTFAHYLTFLNLSILAWKMSIMIIMRQHL